MTETVSRQRSLEQERAAHAYEAVKNAKGKKDKELKSLARSAPASIQSNGLGQTLAFWKAKKEEHHLALYSALSDWLKKQLPLTNDRDLLVWIATEATRGVIDEPECSSKTWQSPQPSRRTGWGR
jgi:CRISPR-associated protein Cmr5